MTEHTTATAGAVRAAEAWLIAPEGGDEARRELAAIIDRETGCGELLAALEALENLVFTLNSPDRARRLDISTQLAQARAAIARARGTAAL